MSEKYKKGWQLEPDHGFQNLSSNTCFWEDYNIVLRFLPTAGIKKMYYILPPRAYVDPMTDDLCSTQCSSVAYEGDRKRALPIP